LDNKTFVIIIGANRSGSTSLYNYLGAHPQIVKSHVGMTGYFLDANYPKAEIPTKVTISSEDTIEKYLTNFPSTKKNIFLEATPDYLYSKNTAANIKAFKQKTNVNLKLICILRNPTERFVSMYKHLIKLDLMPRNINFTSFYNEQNNAYHSPLWQSVFDMGLYSKYLSTFSSLFNKNELMLISFEDLKTRPEESLSKIANWIKVDSTFYHEFIPKIYNASLGSKPTKGQSLYTKIRKLIVKILIRQPILLVLLRPFGKFISKVLFKSSSNPIVIDEKIVEKLKQDYGSEDKAIQNLCPEFNVQW